VQEDKADRISIMNGRYDQSVKTKLEMSGKENTREKRALITGKILS